jgi:2-C-methyl-D-erythritol 4-phosphate cytidylyltransferase
MNTAIIVAGGNGQRLGADIPKQFLKINGKELLSFSVNTFFNHPQIDQVIIVSHGDWLDHVKNLFPDCQVIQGGLTRQDSTQNGLSIIDKNCKNVLIHDAARPFISDKIISDCLSTLSSNDGTAPILESTNSLVNWDGEYAKYIDRSQIKSVQTPQCFKREIIESALRSTISGTDEIGIVLQVLPEAKINFIQGSNDNIKITTAMDLILLREILNNKTHL